MVLVIAACSGAPAAPRKDVQPQRQQLVIELGKHGVVADDPQMAARNREAIRRTIETYSGTGARLLLPEGKIYLDRGPDYASIRFVAATDLELRGRGIDRTHVVIEGDATGGYWVGIEVFDGSHRIELRDFSIEHGDIQNPSPTQQDHLIQINSQSSITADIEIERVYFGPCIGDALRIAGTSPNYVESIRVHDFTMQTDGHPAAPRQGSRSGVSLQRGFRDVEISDFLISGAKNSPIDMEPTAAAAMESLHIHDGIIDNSRGTTVYAASIGGWEDPNHVVSPLRNSSLRRVAILEGQLTLVNTENFVVQDVTLYASSRGPMANAGEPLLYINHYNRNIHLIQLNMLRDTGAGHGGLAVVTHGVDTYPSQLAFDGGSWISRVDANTKELAHVSFESVQDVTLRGIRLVLDGPNPASHHAIRFRSSARDVKRIRLHGIAISSAHGKLDGGVWLAATNSNSIEDIQITGVSASNSLRYGVVFDARAGSKIDPVPVLHGNDFTGALRPWEAINTARQRVNPRVPVRRK